MIAILRSRGIHLTSIQLLLLAFCAFLAIANLYALWAYGASGRQRDVLAEEVGQIERTIQRLRRRDAAGVIGQPLEPGENPFPRELPTAQVAELIAESSRATGVRVDAMTPQLSPPERLAQNSYQAYRLSLRVRGTPSQLADFLTRLERGTIRTWVIDNTQARPLPGDLWEMTFDLTTYGRAAG